MRSQPLKSLFLAALLMSASQLSLAEPKTNGVIRGLDKGTKTVVIDELQLKVTGSTHIRNLAGGTDSILSMEIGQPVRFTAGDFGEVKEIWIYPTEAEKQFKLKFYPGGQPN